MKILVISHESDIDGLGSIVLAKYAFTDLEYLLFSSVATLEQSFREMLENDKLNDYDKIYITDLALGNPSLEMVSKIPAIADRLLVFDHHEASINDKLDIYDFTKIEVINNKGQKRCGTEMFYEYLLDSGFLKESKTLNDFVELTRLEDTWEWKKAGDMGIKAHDLAILMSNIGTKKYIASMLEKINSKLDNIVLTKEEEKLVENKKREYENTLKKLWQQTDVFVDENNNRYGIVVADYEYRNELAEYIRKQEDKREIKYIIIVALFKGAFGQKSYRSIESEFDVNEIAQKHGGGGHKEAASSNLTKEQRDKYFTLDKKEGLEFLAKSSYNE